jgi:nucleoside-diphosphate-sugar epimerase
MTSLVITGAAGWLGLNIVDTLAREGYPGPIRALVLTPSEQDVIRSVGVGLDLHVEVGDVANLSDVRRLLTGCEGGTAIHAAGVIHPRSVSEFTRVNVEGTQNIVRVAQDLELSRLVHISSNSPFGANASPSDFFRNREPYRPYLGYGKSKMEAEHAVSSALLDSVILRPLWFYGPHQPERQVKFFSMVREGKFPLFGGGDNKRSLTYVPDLAHAVVRSMDRSIPSNSAWWIADAQAYSMTQIVEAVQDALQEEGYTVKRSSFKLPSAISTAARAVDKTLQSTGRYNAQLHVLGELGQTIAADASDARAAFELSDSSDLVSGMRASIAWCRDQGLNV